jgi:hypothetical protein
MWTGRRIPVLLGVVFFEEKRCASDIRSSVGGAGRKTSSNGSVKCNIIYDRRTIITNYNRVLCETCSNEKVCRFSWEFVSKSVPLPFFFVISLWFIFVSHINVISRF